MSPTTNEHIGTVVHEDDPSFSEDMDDDDDDDDDDDVLEPNDESFTGMTGRCSEAKSEGNEELANEETKAVVCLKVTVLTVLIVAGIAISISVYLCIDGSEQARFVEKFNDDAAKVLLSIGSSIDRTLRALDNAAVTFAVTAAATNQTWPFVTIPEFVDQMTRILPSSDAIHVDFCPLVLPKQRRQWEKYSAQHDAWINEAMEVQTNYDGYNGPIIYDSPPRKVIRDDSGVVPRNSSRPMFPIWQNFPVVPNQTYTYNWDWSSILTPEQTSALVERHEAVASLPHMTFKQDDQGAKQIAATLAEKVRHFLAPDDNPFEPLSDFIYPVLDGRKHGHLANNTSSPRLVGILSSSIYWRSMFRGVLPSGSNGIDVVIENACTEPFTYQLNGPVARYIGIGDHHDRKYNHRRIFSGLSSLGKDATNKPYEHAPLYEGNCTTVINVYPSDTMRDAYLSNKAVVITVCVLGTYAFTLLIFYLYAASVERRQRRLMELAVQSNTIVSSLFPSTVRDRLYPKKRVAEKKTFAILFPETAKKRLHRDGTNGPESVTCASPFDSAPIAELYPETTVLFADIAGFTAWSSVRQPNQVFRLLESIYSTFDAIAKRRGVFKVETIGDSYVAVVGLPTPRKNHAVIMAIFAEECCAAMCLLVMELEKSLGPGTADLAMRFGLNSGPTTAGVIRGDKSRFQLFGDTVNTAARMESSGTRNKIHVSQKTADLIKLAGKGHWLTARVDEVHCKGKGVLKTFWCNPKLRAGSDSSSEGYHLEKDFTFVDTSSLGPNAKLKLLIDWNVDLFSELLNKIVHGQSPSRKRESLLDDIPMRRCPLDEVVEVVELPHLERNAKQRFKAVQLSPQLMQQLHDLISTIAGLYRKNSFHNFDHCSHVVMSAKKLLDRVAEKAKEGLGLGETSNIFLASGLILSNPLTQFAILFAALIHDIDHPGVSNATLIEEQDPRNVHYDGRSVAEQSSIDIAWNVLMESKFSDLRNCICSNEEELQQFRQILVNVVMATDLFDKDLKAMREDRWMRSFDSPEQSSLTAGDGANRRATILMELIIQASDVSHTMQHFTVYKKWNMCLLAEMCDAYQKGRTTIDPLVGWYEGELIFFDKYIIPLARKLRECGVFGVSSDEFLDYAMDNRLEWEAKGREILDEAAEILCPLEW